MQPPSLLEMEPSERAEPPPQAGEPTTERASAEMTSMAHEWPPADTRTSRRRPISEATTLQRVAKQVSRTAGALLWKGAWR